MPNRSKAPKIDPKEYSEYLRQLQLDSIRLQSLEARLLEDLPSGSAKVDLDYEAVNSEEGSVFAPKAVFTAVVLDDQKVCLKIKAEYSVVYECPCPPPPGFEDVFFRLNLHSLVLPFFREVVATTTARMDLPSLVIPMRIFPTSSDKPAVPRKAAAKKGKASSD